MSSKNSSTIIILFIFLLFMVLYHPSTSSYKFANGNKLLKPITNTPSSSEYRQVDPNDPDIRYLASFAVWEQNRIEHSKNSTLAPLQLTKVIKGVYDHGLVGTLYTLTIAAKRHVNDCLFETDVMPSGIRLYLESFKLAQTNPCT